MGEVDEVRFVWSWRRTAAVWLALFAGVQLEAVELNAPWCVVVVLTIAAGVGLAVYDVKKGRP